MARNVLVGSILLFNSETIGREAAMNRQKKPGVPGAAARLGGTGDKSRVWSFAMLAEALAAAKIADVFRISDNLAELETGDAENLANGDCRCATGIHPGRFENRCKSEILRQFHRRLVRFGHIQKDRTGTVFDTGSSQ